VRNHSTISERYPHRDLAKLEGLEQRKSCAYDSAKAAIVNYSFWNFNIAMAVAFYLDDYALFPITAGLTLHLAHQEVKILRKGPRNFLSGDQSAMANTMSENAPLNSFSRA
jgi:hypothetical protein